MIKHKDHFHGSDLEKIEEIYGIRKEEIQPVFLKLSVKTRVKYAESFILIIREWSV